MAAERRVAVIGAGCSGLSAAWTLSQAGAQVHVYEMAPQAGGRARSLKAEGDAPRLDNGQHILIGAYRDCLALMQALGLDTERLLWRSPLQLLDSAGQGLRLPPGPALLSFARGVMAARHWPLAARWSLMRASMGWLLSGFRCAPQLSVAQLCKALHPRVMEELVAPLCVAALNTPAAEASAEVFLRVLRDALFGPRGAADLLLPRRPLSELLAEPACERLRAAGVVLDFGTRAELQANRGRGWRVCGQDFDAVLLACSAGEAARLAQGLLADWQGTAAEAEALRRWSALAEGLRYEPIITVTLRCPGLRLPFPMLGLREGPDAPGQFLFDLGQLGHAPAHFSVVVSGARPWVDAGLRACADAALRQVRRELPRFAAAEIVHCIAEKRATFACTPALQRPESQVLPGLWAAGDYIAGPYPATLEGAVRSGRLAAQGLLGEPACSG